MTVKAVYTNGTEEIYGNVVRVSKEHEYHASECDCELCKDNAIRGLAVIMPDGTKQICACWLFFENGDFVKIENSTCYTMNDFGKTVDIFSNFR